jgi:hypothetical protein
MIQRDSSQTVEQAQMLQSSVARLLRFLKRIDILPYLIIRKYEISIEISP